MLKELLQTGKTKEDPQKQIQSNLENGNRNVNIYNFIEFKWNKCSNQKDTDWLNGNKRPISELWTHTD